MNIHTLTVTAIISVRNWHDAEPPMTRHTLLDPMVYMHFALYDAIGRATS